MTLVERFLEFGSWPTSRKTFWLLLISLPLHLVFIPAAVVGLAHAGIADMRLIKIIMTVSIVVVCVCMGTGFVAHRLGFDARWTAYMVVVLYSVFLLSLISALGAWSTAMLAWVPCIVILVAIWYDAAIGWFTFAYSIVLITALAALTLAGIVPYAPAITTRTLDAQNSAGWALGLMAPFFAFYSYTFVLCVLVVGARALQDARLNKAQALISRYVPAQLAEKIIKGEHAEFFKPERAKLTFVFSDIEGFTEASDHLDPEDLASLLNEYLSEMMEIADRYGATVSQIVGDGIMIFFGAPQTTTDKDHAIRAVRMAIDMQRRMQEMKDLWIGRGISKPFHIRIGINTGHASVGDYGSQGRKLYSAIGLQTNLAARIQANCATGNILISHSTWALVHDVIPCLDKGEVQVKGVHYPVRIYEVDGSNRLALATTQDRASL